MTVDQLVRLVSELVRTPSVLSDEKAMADRVRSEMQAAGFDQVEVDSAGSVLGVVRGHQPGPTLLLDAHLDTVDVQPRGAWQSDPFSGHVEGDAIHGRGSSDMKGALAAMLLAAAGTDRSRIRGRIVVSASVGEESIEGAALQLVMQRFPPDWVVIGESTGLDLVRAGRGRAEFVVETKGVPAHASTPQLGVNAVLRMHDVIREIEALRMPEHDFVGRGVVCLTDIVSVPFPAHSVVPSACRATYERRLVPGETVETVSKDFRTAVEKAGATDTDICLAEVAYTTYTGHVFRQSKWLPPWELNPTHPLLTRALQALTGAGFRPAQRSYQFCTNAAYSAGVAGVPTLGFGPSFEDRAHRIDESVEIEQVAGAFRGYQALIRELLSL